MQWSSAFSSKDTKGIAAVAYNAVYDSFCHLYLLQSNVVRLDSDGNVTHTFKSVGTKANGLASGASTW